MFWGKGDSSKLAPSEHDVLEALRRMVETGHIVALEPNQTAEALKALEFYRSFAGAFKFFGTMRNVVIIVAGGLMLWWSTGGQNFIAEALKKLVGSP